VSRKLLLSAVFGAAISCLGFGAASGQPFVKSLGPNRISDEQLAHQLWANQTGNCLPLDCERICQDEPTPAWVLTYGMEGAWRDRDRIGGPIHRTPTPQNPISTYYMDDRNEGPSYELIPTNRCNRITPKPPQAVNADQPRGAN